MNMKSRFYRGVPMKKKIKSIVKKLMYIAFAIYFLYLLIIYIFPKEYFLFTHHLDETEIFYEVDVENYGDGFGNTFFIYRKGNEFGFIKTEPRNVNILYPFLPINSRAYSLKSIYTLNINNGETTAFIDGLQYRTETVSKSDNLKLKGYYFYSSHGTPKIKYIYMGIKHHKNYYIKGEEINPAFEVYLEDVFNGAYVYFFESEEILNDDFNIN